MEIQAQQREFEAQKAPTADNIARLQDVISAAVDKERAAEDLKEPETVSPANAMMAEIEDHIAICALGHQSLESPNHLRGMARRFYIRDNVRQHAFLGRVQQNE